MFCGPYPEPTLAPQPVSGARLDGRRWRGAGISRGCWREILCRDWSGWLCARHHRRPGDLRAWQRGCLRLLDASLDRVRSRRPPGWDRLGSDDRRGGDAELRPPYVRLNALPHHGTDAGTHGRIDAWGAPWRRWDGAAHLHTRSRRGRCSASWAALLWLAIETQIAARPCCPPTDLRLVGWDAEACRPDRRSLGWCLGLLQPLADVRQRPLRDIPSAAYWFCWSALGICEPERPKNCCMAASLGPWC